MNISWGTPGFLLKQYIDESDFLKIQALEKLCRDHDGTALKLETEYKLSDGGTRDRKKLAGPIQDFMFYKDDQLVGYLGVLGFGGQAWEVSGMVHPAYRRQGIFSALYRMFLAERQRWSPQSTLLLCDRKSFAGRAFLKTTGAVLEHSEHEMYLATEAADVQSPPLIQLRKAKNSDAPEIARQNRIYFNFGPAEPSDDNAPSASYALMPEEEEKRGMTIYLADLDHETIGKVHIQKGSDVWGIYGLGVLPEYRGRGYGRAILSQAVHLMKVQGAPAILLQVDAENDRALGLYLSCGFKVTSVMDYYLLS